MIILKQKIYTGKKAAARYINKLNNKILEGIENRENPELIGKLVDKSNRATEKHSGMLEKAKEKLLKREGKHEYSLSELENRFKDKNFKKLMNTKKTEEEYKNKLNDLMYRNEDYFTNNGKFEQFSDEYENRVKYYRKRYRGILGNIEKNVNTTDRMLNNNGGIENRARNLYDNKIIKKANNEAEEFNKNLINKSGLTTDVDKNKIKRALYKNHNNELNETFELTRDNKKNWKKHLDHKINDAKNQGIDFSIDPNLNNAFFQKGNRYENSKIVIGGKYRHDPLTVLHEIGHSEGERLPYDNILEKIKEETRADQNIIKGIKNNPNIHNNSKKQMLKSAEKFKKLQPNNNYKIHNYLEDKLLGY